MFIWIAVGYFIFYEQEKFIQVITNPRIQWKWIFLSFIFLPLNIGLEATKWFLMVKKYYPDLKFFIACQAILAGSASGFITPQKLGDYVGRLLYLSKENRVAAAVATFLDRLAQLGATLIFTVFALFYLKFPWYFFLGITFFAILFHSLLWTFPKWFSYFLKWFPFLIFLRKGCNKFSLKLQVLISFLSVIRFMVFLCQYILIFWAYEVNHKNLWALCCLIFFLKSFLPSLAFSELGIREGIAIWVFSQFTEVNSVVVFQVTFLLFVINTLVPVAFGAWLIKNLKI